MSYSTRLYSTPLYYCTDNILRYTTLHNTAQHYTAKPCRALSSIVPGLLRLTGWHDLAEPRLAGLNPATRSFRGTSFSFSRKTFSLKQTKLPNLCRPLTLEACSRRILSSNSCLRFSSSQVAWSQLGFRKCTASLWGPRPRVPALACVPRGPA